MSAIDSRLPNPISAGERYRASPPKNADRAEYHRATGLEALIGYLYITGHEARMREILDAATGDIE